jgi:large conductance mechanosensitive channel
MWEDFKKFAFRGNVLDLAVAVVIGAAFGAIVNSFVNDIIMPVIGYLTAGISFSDLKIVLAAATTANGKAVPEVAITYGKLIQTVIQFLVIACSVFSLIRVITKAREKMEARRKKVEDVKPAEPAPKPDDVLLLEEIRDLLKKS